MAGTDCSIFLLFLTHPVKTQEINEILFPYDSKFQMIVNLFLVG